MSLGIQIQADSQVMATNFTHASHCYGARECVIGGPLLRATQSSNKWCESLVHNFDGQNFAVQPGGRGSVSVAS